MITPSHHTDLSDPNFIQIPIPVEPIAEPQENDVHGSTKSEEAPGSEKAGSYSIWTIDLDSNNNKELKIQTADEQKSEEYHDEPQVRDPAGVRSSHVNFEFSLRSDQDENNSKGPVCIWTSPPACLTIFKCS